MTPTQRNDLRTKAMAALNGEPAKYFLTTTESPVSIEQRKIDAEFMRSSSPDVILALLTQLEEYEEALKRIAPLNSEGPYQAILAPGIAQQALAKYQGHGG